MPKPRKTAGGGRTVKVSRTSEEPGGIEPNLDGVYGRIKAVLTEARGRAWQAVNAAMVAAYWEVGRIIVEVEQAGRERAGYGSQLLQSLSDRLTNRCAKN